MSEIFDQISKSIEAELNNSLCENDFEVIKNNNVENHIDDLVRKNQYEDGTPISLNRELFNQKYYDWFSNIAAVDLISTKNIDVFISDQNWNLLENETFNFDYLLKQNYLEVKIFDLAKKVSLTGLGCLWFEPIFNQSFGNKYSLSSQVNIIQIKIVNNVIQKATFLVNIVRGIAIGSIYALVEADQKSYKTKFYNLANDYKFNSDESFAKKHKDSEVSRKTVKEALSSLNNDHSKMLVDYLNKDHNLGFVPIFPLFFNDDFSPIIKNIQQDMDELYSISHKMYDESHFMGTKVIWLNANSSATGSNQTNLLYYQKVLAASAAIIGNDEFGNDNSKSSIDLQVKSPIFSQLNDALKQKINNILKTLGLSSDTDSKGTVQQSVGEIIKQNEYSYNNQNYRNVILQNYLQNLLEKFYHANFGNETNKVKVLSTQSLGMSEYEKLRYVIDAKNNGVIDQARAISIITGKNYIDSIALSKIQKLKDINPKPIKESFPQIE